MLSYTELEKFYEGLVSKLRERGVVCGITSGMACVTYGVAATTKDCDMLCDPLAAAELLQLLCETELKGCRPVYRSHITPPLDTRWLSGGWTSHFQWRVENAGAYLDVFGVAPRASSPWQSELQGFYAGPHTVAEMKRTDRQKDWPFATVLGVKLLEAGDARGWLHIFDHIVLLRSAEKLACPPDMVARRPLLKLVAARDEEQLELAVRGEIEFWHRLDRVRMKIHERAVRPYMVAVKRDARSDAPDLPTQHQCRVEHAERLLARNPLRDYGLHRLIAEARDAAEKFAPPGSLQWLPDVRGSFIGLSE
jgi:hypothetical protein